MSEQSVNHLSTDAAEKLRTFYDRVNRLDETIAEFNDEKKDLYKELKSLGYDVAAFKKMVQRGKKQRNDVEEADSILDLYEMAIGLVRP